jgi:hypothetical protein
LIFRDDSESKFHKQQNLLKFIFYIFPNFNIILKLKTGPIDSNDINAPDSSDFLPFGEIEEELNQDQNYNQIEQQQNTQYNENDYVTQSYDTKNNNNNKNSEEEDAHLLLNTWPNLIKQVNESLYVTCSTNQQDQNIVWRRVNIDRKNDDNQQQILNTEKITYGVYTHSTLIFKNLKRNDQGIYVCRFSNAQNTKNATLNLTVFDRPAKPQILEVKPNFDKKTTLVRWFLEDNGGLNIKRVHVKWSEDFSMPSFPIRNKCKRIFFLQLKSVVLRESERSKTVQCFSVSVFTKNLLKISI